MSRVRATPRPHREHPAHRAHRPRARWSAAALLGLLAALPGCALFEPQIAWRSYPLEDISYAEGVALVRDVTGRFMTERFGGLGMTWDPETRNLTVDDVYDATRRLRLRLHVEPSGTGIDVEMLALVHHLSPGDAGRIWGHAQQDVPLEEMLYEAMLAEYLARRGVPR